MTSEAVLLRALALLSELVESQHGDAGSEQDAEGKAIYLHVLTDEVNIAVKCSALQPGATLTPFFPSCSTSGPPDDPTFSI